MICETIQHNHIFIPNKWCVKPYNITTFSSRQKALAAGAYHTLCRLCHFNLLPSQVFLPSLFLKETSVREEHKMRKFKRLSIFVTTHEIRTHSSITSPSPTTRGPVSTGGFLRVSSAASASANWRFSFSKA